MKSIAKLLLAMVLFTGSTYFANAQNPSGNLEVTSRLKENSGTYDERKLYRQFLEQYVKDCPYISHFSIREAVGTADNHEVEWHYRADSWEQITQFYTWLSQQIKSSEEDGIKMALRPYGPDYSLGGKITVAKTRKGALAKH